MYFGRFPEPAHVELINSGEGHGRLMRLLRDFTYFDPHGGNWTAKKGFETDGASIPQAFWSVVGGPFEGDYRDAAIIHDSYCHSKDRPWQDVHRVFYYGSRAAGVSERKSKILYAAVLYGGPKWKGGDSTCYAACHSKAENYSHHGDKQVYQPAVHESEAEALVEWIEKFNPTLEEIDARLLQRHPMEMFAK